MTGRGWLKPILSTLQRFRGKSGECSKCEARSLHYWLFRGHKRRSACEWQSFECKSRSPRPIPHILKATSLVRADMSRQEILIVAAAIALCLTILAVSSNNSWVHVFFTGQCFNDPKPKACKHGAGRFGMAPPPARQNTQLPTRVVVTTSQSNLSGYHRAVRTYREGVLDAREQHRGHSQHELQLVDTLKRAVPWMVVFPRVS